MSIKYTLLLLAPFLYGAAYSQTAPGFVQQENIKIPGITTDAQIYPLTDLQKQTTRAYYDGLGRTVQTIGLQASPAGHDLIQPVVYDSLGRQVTGYLPYSNGTDASGSFRSNAVTSEQPAFYNNTGQYLIPVDGSPYSQRVFENSPLQRLLDAGMDGAGFQPTAGRYKTVSYRPNNSTADGNILQWNADGTFTTGTYYAPYSLQVTDGKDEDNTEILTFTDYAGRTVLKRQKYGSANYDTYYIYNNAGMLYYVIPPLATNKLAANSYLLNSAPLSNMIFKYMYDTRCRLTQRTIPGKGVMYTVYDPLNRPVLMQDAYLRTYNQWNYIKYDSKGRIMSQGIYTDGNNTSLTAMQIYVSALSYATWCETRNTTLLNGGYYTDNAFPTGAVTGTSISPLAYAYFDDYNIAASTPTFSYVPQKDTGLPNEESQTKAAVKGMPTVVMKTTVGSALSGIWLTSAIFYDHRLHTIQQQSNNQLNYTNALTLTDSKTVVTTFTGMPLSSKVTKKHTATDTVSVYTSMSYDQMYRITQIRQQYDNAGFNPVAQYSYNEVGQLTLKHLGFISTGNWLQNEDFRYNIRGWLLSINNSKLTPDGGKTNSDINDVFGMQLMYDQPDSALSNTRYYDGKPSGVKWMTRNYSNTRTQERSYLYSYNALNWYTGETYAERDSTSVGTSPYNINNDGFDEYGITMDGGGNLQTLSRNSSVVGASTHKQIDTLAYIYSSTSPNQLLRVVDGTDSVHTSHGFRNLTGSSTNYAYDSNGNLTNDYLKGLTIGYNELNRTDKITVTTGTNQYINYIYDGGGNLIEKQAYNGGTLQTTTDYVDGFVYITQGTGGTPTLSYFPMPEGRIVNVSGALTQEFIMTDQQGNARVAFRNVGGVAKVWQENSYYGTGLILPNSPVSTPTVPNKQLYNGGSEWQNDYSNLPDYYETPNRNYDAAIGRFISVDPQAESAETLTSYQYAGMNPIVNNDPLGNALDPSKRPIPWNGPPINPNVSGPIPEDDDQGAAGDFQIGDFYVPVAGPYGAFWDNAISNLNELIGGLNNSNYNSVDFQSTSAFIDFGRTILDPNQDYNYNVSSSGAQWLSIHHDVSVIPIEYDHAPPTSFDLRNPLTGQSLKETQYNMTTRVGVQSDDSDLFDFQVVQTIRANYDSPTHEASLLEPFVDQPWDAVSTFFYSNLDAYFATHDNNAYNIEAYDSPGLVTGYYNYIFFYGETSVVARDDQGIYQQVATWTWSWNASMGQMNLGPMNIVTPSKFQQQAIDDLNVAPPWL